MSPIGIRQAIVYLDHMYDWRTMSDEDIVAEAQPVEQSLRAWGNQFPKDPWLPPTAYHLMQLYAEIQTSGARAHAFTMMYYIVGKWPSTKEANLCRERLTQGFPPFHDEPPLRPTMPPSTPTPTPTPEETPTPSVIPSVGAQSAPKSRDKEAVPGHEISARRLWAEPATA